jgi:hypothetical protein
MVAAVAAATIASCLTSPGLARDYFVNNTVQDASDDGPGTRERPFRTFGPLNRISEGGGFPSGTGIYLAAGCVWNEQLTIRQAEPVEAGTWSYLGAYGDGPRPKILRDGHWSSKCVVIEDVDYWRVRGLELGHAGAGLVLWYTTLGHRSVELLDLYVHHCFGVVWNMDFTDPPRIWNSAGIVVNFRAKSPESLKAELDRVKEPFVLDGLHVRWVEGTRNSISLDIGSDQPFPAVYGWRNVVLRDLHFHDDDAGHRHPNVAKCQEYGLTEADCKAEGGCPGSLLVVGANHGTVLNTIIDRSGAGYTTSGTGPYSVAATDFNFVNGMIVNTPDTGSPDQSGTDLETLEDRVRIRNTFYGSNYGSAIEILSALDDPSVDTEISGNTFVHNGVNVNRHLSALGGVPLRSFGALVRANGGSTKVGGGVRDNFFVEPSGFAGDVWASNPGGWKSYSFAGNRVLARTESVFHAAADFTDVQGRHWYYHRRESDGAPWSEMQYSRRLEAWNCRWESAEGASVGRFTLVSGGSHIARSWRAPRDGKISVRARAIKEEVAGATVSIRITRFSKESSMTLWPSDAPWHALAYDDLAGVETNLTDLSVMAGDWVRFELKGGGPGDAGAVSWVPAVAYTNDRAYDWGFDFPRDWMGPLGLQLLGDPKSNVGMEGWGSARDLEAHVSAGTLHLVFEGPQPQIVSPDHLGLDGGEFPSISIGYTNQSEKPIAARLRFINLADEAWNDAKSVPITLNSGAANVELDMGEVDGWRSSPVKQLRLDFTDPANRDCALDVDFIRVAR